MLDSILLKIMKFKMPTFNYLLKIQEDCQSGIYEIKCNDCNKKYIGQTKRKIKTRYSEHVSHIKYNRPKKSAVASHCLENNQLVSLSNLKIIKPISNATYLNAWEIFFINSNNSDQLLNQDLGPIQNSLLLDTHFITKLK